MKVKETIAFIGAADEMCSDLIRKLALKKYPLILVNNEGNHFTHLSRQILDHIPQADIEIIDCVKEGCWEADIIILTNAINPEPGLSEKIKEVATQKILVCFSGGGDASFSEALKGFEQLLPNTEVVQVIPDAVSGELHITGTAEPVAVVEAIFIRAGYKTGFQKTIL